jgi:hypothetical protein
MTLSKKKFPEFSLTGRFLGVFASMVLISCGSNQESGTLNTQSAFEIDPNDPFLKYSEQEILELFSGTSCNSMGGASATSSSLVDYSRGLRGRMKSAPVGFEANFHEWFDLNRFDQPDAVTVPGQVFFDRLNVPTRLFDEGFPKLNGELVLGPTGNPLMEFFRIDFDGLIEVGSNEYGEYNYEFAAIADDGVIMKINNQTIINDPFVTPPKLMCGNQSVFMSPEEPLNFELAYSQAPRYHIALVLLWRKVLPGTTPEPMCGYNGVPGTTFAGVTSAWFNWQLPGSPASPNYNALLSRGWSVVEQENFRVPAGVDLNPCSSAYVQSVFANQSSGQ